MSQGRNIMSKSVRPADGADLDSARKCRVHGLLFDPAITETCPLCEYERADRIASIHQ